MVKAAVRSSPTAQKKLDKLVAGDDDDEEEWEIDEFLNIVSKRKEPPFEKRNFTTLVIDEEVEGLLDTFTVLQVVREINGVVAETLPASVYTVTAHGPLFHDMCSSVKTVKSGHPKGRAAASRIIGSYTSSQQAKVAAKRVMDDMVKDEVVSRTEKWEGKGDGNGLLMAINDEAAWECRVAYEEDALRGAVGRFDEAEEKKGSKRRANWRY